MIAILTILLIYIALIIDVIRIFKTKKDVEGTISFQRALMFGASNIKDIDENNVKYGTFQIALGCFILTITYTV